MRTSRRPRLNGAAGAERISGRRKPHPEGPAERSIEALGCRASHPRRDRSPPGPQGFGPSRNCGPAGHHPGLVPQASRPQIDGSKARRGPGRPRVAREVEQLIVRMASENRDWGYDRIAGALANLGYEISDQTVGNVPRRHALPPAPERKRTTTWPAFIQTHLALLAGTDFSRWRC
jgi:Homeodomain-like domain